MEEHEEKLKDDTIRLEMWDGKIPVCLRLAPAEVTDLQPPKPLFMLMPRMGYLHLFLAEIRDHFASFAPARNVEVWFESAGVPLKWTLPVGVSFDLLNGGKTLPWPITVHFMGFPAAKLLRCKGEQAIRRHFINAFKEALLLSYGKNPVGCLKSNEQNQLWDSVQQGKYYLFQPIARAVSAGRSLEKYPVRVLIDGFNAHYDHRLIQRSLTTSDTRPIVTLRDCLTRSVPGIVSRYFPAATTDADAGGSDTDAASSSSSGDEESAVETEGDTGTASSSSSGDEESAAVKTPAVFVQGLRTPLETPLEWLVNHCAHPDHFLYVCVVNHPANR